MYCPAVKADEENTKAYGKPYFKLTENYIYQVKYPNSKIIDTLITTSRDNPSFNPHYNDGKFECKPISKAKFNLETLPKATKLANGFEISKNSVTLTMSKDMKLVGSKYVIDIANASNSDILIQIGEKSMYYLPKSKATGFTTNEITLDKVKVDFNVDKSVQDNFNKK